MGKNYVTGRNFANEHTGVQDADSSHIRNCIFKPIQSDAETLLFDLSVGPGGGDCIVRMDGYAIVPRAEYELLRAEVEKLNKALNEIISLAAEEDDDTGNPEFDCGVNVGFNQAAEIARRARSAKEMT